MALPRILRQFLILGFLIYTVPAFATTYYVRTGGNDTNNCTSAQTDDDMHAKATINGGKGCATSPGDTVIIHAGTYAERLNSGWTSGTAGNPITFRAATNETVILQPAAGGNQAIEIDGFAYITIDISQIDNINSNPTTNQSSDCIKLTDAGGGAHADHIVLQNIEFINCTIGLLSGSTNSTFSNLTAHNLPDANPMNLGGTGHGGYGLYLTGANNLIDHFIVHDNEGWGITVYLGSNFNLNSGNVIRNSVIYANCQTVSGCAGLGLGSIQNTAYNNLIYNNLGAGGGIDMATGIGTGGSGTQSNAWNNTIVGNTGTCISMGNSEFDTAQNNICYQNGADSIDQTGAAGQTIIPNLLGTDPVFVSSSDYHLQAGSPAIDAGTTLAAVTSDYDGVARPQPAGGSYDDGAYEAGATPPPPGPITWWKLDENTGSTAGDSADSNPSTITNPSWTTGQFGSALAFNGMNASSGGTYAVAADATNLNVQTGNFTISAWVYPTATSPPSFIMAKEDCGDSGNWQLGWSMTGHTQEFRFRTVGGSGTLALDTASMPALNTWHLVTGTVSGGTATLYLDGSSVTSGTQVSMITTTRPVTIGIRYGAISNPSGCGETTFPGRIDDVRIYNRALSSTEVADLYAGATCTPSKLVFTNQPSNAVFGATLGNVNVSVEDSMSNVCTSATNTITIANTGGTCPGMTLGGTVSGTPTTGVFQTTNLTESGNSGGACTITATASGLTSDTSSSFNIGLNAAQKTRGFFKLYQ